MREKFDCLINTIKDNYKMPLCGLATGVTAELLFPGDMGLLGRLTCPIPGSLLFFLNGYMNSDTTTAVKWSAGFYTGFFVGNSATAILMQYISQ